MIHLEAWYREAEEYTEQELHTFHTNFLDTVDQFYEIVRLELRSLAFDQGRQGYGDEGPLPDFRDVVDSGGYLSDLYLLCGELEDRPDRRFKDREEVQQAWSLLGKALEQASSDRWISPGWLQVGVVNWAREIRDFEAQLARYGA